MVGEVGWNVGILDVGAVGTVGRRVGAFELGAEVGLTVVGATLLKRYRNISKELVIPREIVNNF